MAIGAGYLLQAGILLGHSPCRPPPSHQCCPTFINVALIRSIILLEPIPDQGAPTILTAFGVSVFVVLYFFYPKHSVEHLDSASCS